MFERRGFWTVLLASLLVVGCTESGDTPEADPEAPAKSESTSSQESTSSDDSPEPSEVPTDETSETSRATDETVETAESAETPPSERARTEKGKTDDSPSAPAPGGAGRTSAQKDDPTGTSDFARAQLSIDALDGDGGPTRLQETARDLPGVRGVEASSGSSELVVHYDTSKIGAEDIAPALSNRHSSDVEIELEDNMPAEAPTPSADETNGTPSESTDDSSESSR